MNWELNDLLEEALMRGNKAIWILYRAKENGIPFSLEDIKKIGEAYNHHPKWAYYMAIEFKVLGEKKKEPPPKKEPPKTEPPRGYPSNYFMNVHTKEQLKKVFRDWSKKLHPDMATGNSQEFIKMKNQYDSMKRRLIYK